MNNVIFSLFLVLISLIFSFVKLDILSNIIKLTVASHYSEKLAIFSISNGLNQIVPLKLTLEYSCFPKINISEFILVDNNIAAQICSDCPYVNCISLKDVDPYYINFSKKIWHKKAQKLVFLLWFIKNTKYQYYLLKDNDAVAQNCNISINWNVINFWTYKGKESYFQTNWMPSIYNRTFYPGKACWNDNNYIGTGIIAGKREPFLEYITWNNEQIVRRQALFKSKISEEPLLNTAICSNLFPFTHVINNGGDGNIVLVGPPKNHYICCKKKIHYLGYATKNIRNISVFHTKTPGKYKQC